jgi:hypothetical protein
MIIDRNMMLIRKEIEKKKRKDQEINKMTII